MCVRHHASTYVKIRQYDALSSCFCPQGGTKDEEFGVTRGIDFKGVRTIINYDLPSSVQVGGVGRIRGGRGKARLAHSAVCSMHPGVSSLVPHRTRLLLSIISCLLVCLVLLCAFPLPKCGIQTPHAGLRAPSGAHGPCGGGGHSHHVLQPSGHHLPCVSWKTANRCWG